MIFFTLQLTFNVAIFGYSVSQKFLNKNYEIGFLKLERNIEINNKVNVNQTNKKFYYVINGIDRNNNQIFEEHVIDISEIKYSFNEIVNII